MIHARLEPGDLRPDAELTAFLAEADGAGAVVSFVGVTRAIDKDGAQLTGLFLDHYPGLTERVLMEIAEAAMARFGTAAIRVVHRCGMVAPGAPIVFAAAAAPHRRAAFEAADYLMDRLKTDAIFWKREDGADGTSRWIEPTDADRADRERWS